MHDLVEFVDQRDYVETLQASIRCKFLVFGQKQLVAFRTFLRATAFLDVLRREWIGDRVCDFFPLNRNQLGQCLWHNSLLNETHNTHAPLFVLVDE